MLMHSDIAGPRPVVDRSYAIARSQGVRGHRRAGLTGTSALTWPGMAIEKRYKGGIGGIIASVVLGAAVGAVTGGLGVLAFGADPFSMMGMEFIKDSVIGGMVKGAVLGAIGGLLSGVAGLLLAPDNKSQAYQATDNKLTTRNSVSARRMVLGTALVGGTLVYVTSTGATHQDIHMVQTLASHRVQAVREASFNNVPESDARFAGNYRINRHLGYQRQAADADLIAAAGGEWTTAHRLQEIAYFYQKLTYSTSSWVSGLPSTSHMVDGFIAYDPRKPAISLFSSAAGVFTTSTPHGFAADDIVFVRDHLGATYSGPNGAVRPVAKWYEVDTVPSPTSFTLKNDSGLPMSTSAPGYGGTVTKCGWSNNWALGVLSWLVSRNGMGANLEEINFDSFCAAADISDQDVLLGNAQTFTVSPTSNVLTIAASSGWTTGTQVYVSSTGTLPAPLQPNTAYYWIQPADAQDSSMGMLAASYKTAVGYNAVSSSDSIAANQAIDITDVGSGVHTISAATSGTASSASDTITLSSSSTYIETGDCVNLLGASSTDFYWINTGYLSGKLASSRANAMAGIAVDLTIDGAVRIVRKAQARYTINGVVDGSRKRMDILNDLLTAGGGVMVYSQGQYKLFAAAPGAVTLALDETFLRGDIQILPHTSHQTLSNAIRGTYKEPAQYWEMTDFPPLTNPTYEAEDGGQRLYQDVAFPHTIDAQRAQRLASIALGRARRGMVVNFPGTIKLLGISAWDCVSLSINIAGISGKKFRVVYWSLAKDGQGIDLTLNEEDDAIYDWSAAQGKAVVQNDLSSLPSPWIVAPPSNLTLQAGASEIFPDGNGSLYPRILARWASPQDSSVVMGGRIELQYKKSGDVSWSPSMFLNGSSTSCYITDITDSTYYDVRIRSVNLLGAKSDSDGEWSTTTRNFYVTGTASPPAPIAQISIGYVGGITQMIWQPVSDLRPIDYEIRKGASPESGQLISRTPNTVAPTSGDGTYWISPHIRTPSGQDVYAAQWSEVVVAGSQLTSNVIAGWEESQSGWGGPHSNIVASQGGLGLAALGDILSSSNILALQDILSYGGYSSQGSYQIPASHRVNIGRVAPCNVLISASSFGFSPNDNVLSSQDILSLPDILGLAHSSSITVQPQIRLSQDGVTWGNWQDWFPASYSAMAFDARVIMGTSDSSITPILTGFSFEVDVPDRTDFFRITVPSAGVIVRYADGLQGNPTALFNGGPKGSPLPNVQITIVNAQPGDQVALTAESSAGFTVQIVNNGAGVSRTVNIASQGY